MERTISSVIWNTKSFRWDIRNFSDICGIRDVSVGNEEISAAGISHSSQEYNCLLDIDFLQSPIIEVGPPNEGSQSHWLVRLVKSSENANKIELHLEFLVTGTELEENNETELSECFFKYNIEIIGSDGQPFIKKDNHTIIFLKSGNSWCEPDLLKVDHLKSHMNEVLRDDTLELKVDLFVLNDLHHSRIDGLSDETGLLFPINSKKRKYTPNLDWQEVLNSCQLKLAKQVLNNFWKTRLNTDATINCANIQFPIHKSILSSASPVFSATFTHDMCENTENRVVITDISPSTMENVLRFIYCDTNLDESQWKNVDDLAEMLNAAEKYQMPTLKTLCFSKLCEELTLSNAGQITVLVYLFEPEECVKHFVHQYVMRNLNVLKETASFKKRMNEIPAAFTPLLLLVESNSNNI